MGSVASLKERYVLYVGKAFGIRGSDFIALTYGQFRRLHLDEEVPIAFGEVNTIKENVRAFPFLDVDAIAVVKAMLEANANKKDSDRVLRINEESLSLILQSLARKSGIDPHGSRIRFHILRKWLIDRLSAVASESQWKQIVGKQISESAYVSTEQLRDVYARAMPSISVSLNGTKTKYMEELEARTISQQKEISELKAQIEAQIKRISELEHDSHHVHKAIGELEEFRDIVERKLNIKQKVEGW
jgi:uncharacterized coiled-coil protein SlyX